MVGCGDVGMRCVALLQPRARLFALTTQPARCAELRAAGVTPLVGDLDARASLKRLAGLAPTVLHLAPPPRSGAADRRTRALLAALRAHPRRPAASPTAPVGRLRRRTTRGVRETGAIVPEVPYVPGSPGAAARSARRARPVRIVYASTTGVYGDCGGAWVDETRPVRPATPRAQRRVSAEQQLRHAAARGAVHASIARVPGIYAGNRLPLARLEKRVPALCEADDVYTNHIHADDLAAILVAMTLRAQPSRIFHASDDTVLKMGEYFDAVADALGLPRAPRLSRDDAQAVLDPMLLSFMRESRRLSNGRMKRELRVRLRYPTVADFLRGCASAPRSGERG